MLNDRSRAASVPRGNVLRCDQRDIPHTRWYRFTGSSGTGMPTKCVLTNRCGTHAPGWLTTPHPTRIGQIANGKVCFHWSGNCCRWSANIQIKMCNGYYIYKLPKTPCCYLRYCGNAGFGRFSAVSKYRNGFRCLNQFAKKSMISVGKASNKRTDFRYFFLDTDFQNIYLFGVDLLTLTKRKIS